MMFVPHYHVAFVVADLKQAMHEMAAALHLTWARVEHLDLDAGPVYYTYSREGPPYVELLQGLDGSPWPLADKGFHHTGYWSDNLEADRRRLDELGWMMQFDGALIGRKFVLYMTNHGSRIELVDVSRREEVRRWTGGPAAEGPWSKTT